MIKYFVWTLGSALFLLFGICSVSEARMLPALQSGINIQSAQSQTGQTQNTSQKRPNQFSEQNKRQSIPKPERNKLEETRGKKAAGSRKRKSRGNNAPYVVCFSNPLKLHNYIAISAF